MNRKTTSHSSAGSIKKRTWTSRSRGTTLGNRIFMLLICAGGVRPAYMLLRFVALWFVIADRSVTTALRRFHSQAGLPDRFTNIYNHFCSFGESLIDGYAFLAKGRPPFTYRCEGEEHIAAALEKGKGIILLSAHMGSSEVAANLLVDRIKTPVNLIMLDEDSEAMRRVFDTATSRRRISIIPVTNDPLAMMVQVRTALARNEIVCMGGDRVSKNEETRLIDFLGKPARFPAGPFIFSALTGAPVIAVFSIKDRRAHYRLSVSGMIDTTYVGRSERSAAINRAMRHYVNLLEEQARHHPLQWFNMYEYWEQPR